ncbi:AGAP002222-PA-like protein [Anopheles sinensis]|uniref:AGAP002222-PA-like protein n=1 Tax=Anopheles sinensis TaxID=74873 RepID=A0A084W104_ANOSI|nr:AGAP002222-PA-like protein [Anopheles sinensis]
MSYSPPSYMDGVPVKISERFKPPPKIVLPQGVVNRLHQYDVGQVLRESCYECELEDTVLKRITEWKAIRERERCERKARLQLREQEQLRFIEAEQKRKLNQISYPNTDELSSASDDNEADEGGRGAGGGVGGRRVPHGSDEEDEEDNDESAPSGSSDERGNVKPFDHMSQLNSILVPTVIRDAVPSAAETQNYSNVPANANFIPKTTLAGTDTPALANATHGSNNNNNNNNYNKINYSDFENDTSSPFDNMELRTINDLDILAQVLKQNTTLTSPSNDVANNDTESVKPNESQEAPAEVKEQATYPLATTDSFPSQPVQSQPQQQQQHLSPQSTDNYHTAYSTNQQYSMYPSQYQQASQTTVAKSGVTEYLPSSYGSYQPYGTYGTPYDTRGMAAACYPSTNTTDNRYGMHNYTSPTYHVPPVVSQAHQQTYQQPTGGSNYSYGYHSHPAVSYVTAPSTSQADGTGGTKVSEATVYAANYGYHTASTDTTSSLGYNSVQMPHAGGYHGYQSASSSSGAGMASMYAPTYVTHVEGTDAATGLKSKSKSVPDIVRQLNDEVQDSVTRRTRNNSQTISDRQSTTTTSSRSGDEIASSSADERRIDYTKYNQLVQADQHLVKQISAMGFPLERVIWVLQRLGNDDKKIIEHIIPLSELLDLGFEVEKISDALLRFGNNKHKALDYLIS